MARRAFWIYLAILLIFGSLHVLFPAPCVAAKKSSTSLRERAISYWKYRVANELDKAFTYEYPESVKGLTLTDYSRGFGAGVRWLAAEVGQINVDGDKARLQVKIRYVWTFTPHNPKEGIVSYKWEDWRKVNGTWFHVYSGLAKPPNSAKPEGKKTGAKQ